MIELNVYVVVICIATTPCNAMQYNAIQTQVKVNKKVKGNAEVKVNQHNEVRQVKRPSFDKN